MNKFKKGDKVKHRNGGIYAIEDEPNEGRLLENCAETFYEYSGSDGVTWLRCKSEMEDGRFVKIKDSTEHKKEPSKALDEKNY